MEDRNRDRTLSGLKEPTIGGAAAAGFSQTAQEHDIENPEGLNLFLFSQNGAMQECFLPYPPKGRYLFSEDIPVVMDAGARGWHVRHLAGKKVFGPAGSRTSEQILYHHCMIPFRHNEEEYMLYAEEVNENSRAYHNYVILENSEITIGRADDNDIIYPDHLISRHHASISYRGGIWRVADQNSSNGVFVNGYRIQNAVLKTGDEICIIGLRMIIGCGFLSMNDGNQRIHITQEKLMPAEPGGMFSGGVFADENRKRGEMFSRFPRRRLLLEEKEIEIAGPPMPMSGDRLPLLMRMGGSMVMSGTAALTGNISMLATSIMFPLLSQQYTKEDKEEYEKNRKERYRAYLDHKWQEIQEEKEHEEHVLNVNYPAADEILCYPEQRKKLWERKKNDDDFLTLRIGTGNIPMKAKLKCPARVFQLEEDVLEEEMLEMTEKEVILESVPILQNLTQDTVWGVMGDWASALQFAKTMILRLSLLYSYDEVKLVFLMDQNDLDQMEFIRYLPHVWDDQRTIRFVATEMSEAYQIGDYISKSLEEDLEKPRKLQDMMQRHPYYVVFAFSKSLLDSMEVMKTAMAWENTCGISVIAVFDDVPKESSILFRMESPESRNLHTVIYPKHIDKEDERFLLDPYQEKHAEKAMHQIANIQLKLLTESFNLPKTLTFLEMLNAGRIEHLNIQKRWQENNPVKSLAVPVGVQTDGSVFMLDLHQKFQGPHGLVAGTTGSGKSEFLLTYILSLALNFHPDEVAFVLIDYKGGGLAGAFDDPANGIHLPHLVGTITNLDGSAIARSLVSIQSEMKRRQRVFNEAKSAVQEGTMDIYLYQKLYRNGQVTEPMPHLFIISDEFAELKQQQPEFLDQLVSIARIGRSLGVHLILATQKPAGVVTDQIVSNTKFRVCLKVQDKSDSMDMLKRPEASEIRETGRFYLQVGNNELFALGQSAWSGAQYEPQEEVVVKKDDSIQVIDHIGANILEVRPQVEKVSSGQSQLVAIVKTITQLAEEMQIKPRSLWMPPLSDKYNTDTLHETYQNEYPDEPGSVSFCAGLLDDPETQMQHPLIIDLANAGNLFVVGEPGSGKTTFVQNMLYSLARDYTPEQVSFYVLDYSSRLLKLFKNLPHCGAVLGEEEEGSLNAFFKLVSELTAERKKLFTELEADNYEAACRIRSIPLILIVIDNIAGMGAGKIGQSHLDRMQSYIKGTSGYGICFVFTASYQNEVPVRVRQLLAKRICLHMKDKYEYGEALNYRITYLPPEKSGRGLCMYDERPLEMQLSMFEPDEETADRVTHLKEKLSVIARKNSMYEKARTLHIISNMETYEDFTAAFRKGRIPLGYDVRNAAEIALPLKQFSMLSLYFGARDSITPVMKNFMYAAEKEQMDVYFMKRTSNSCVDRIQNADDSQKLHIYDTQDALKVSEQLIGELRERFKIFNAFCLEHQIDPMSEGAYKEAFEHMYTSVRPILLVIERYADLCEETKRTDGLLNNYSMLYQLGKYVQIYIAAGFYPSEDDLLVNKLNSRFNPEKLIMLFGGSLDKQSQIRIPYEMTDKEKTPYNRCLMHYRGNFYRLMMPCGAPEEEEIPEDDRPIFL